MPAPPLVSVVMCTYNRADVMERTLCAVLDQRAAAFEVVVVDDGSTDATPKVLAALNTGDPRLRVVRQENTGMASARNRGIAEARGRWLVFLDDDDLPHTDWLATLAEPMHDPDVGITCCGARAVDPGGNEICPLPVIDLPEPFRGVRGAYRAGTFAVRADLCREAGAYLEGLGTSEQFELFIRILHQARQRGLRVAGVDRIVLDIERRPARERRSSNPWVAYDATVWTLERHPELFATAPGRVAAFEGVAGVAAARTGRWRLARRHLWRSARREPRSRARWARLALVLVPLLAHRVWTRQGTDAYDATQMGVPLQVAAGAELFLAWRYRENGTSAATRPAASIAPGPARLARRLARRRPDAQLCLGELERHDDPAELLRQLAQGGGDIVIATPDRARTDPDRPLGPPSNPHHRREWTREQLQLLLRSTGFDVARSWRRGKHQVVLATAA